MKYTTPVAELLALEAVSVILSSTEEEGCLTDCEDMLEEF